MLLRLLATLVVGAAAALASGWVAPATGGGVSANAIANVTTVDYRAVVTARRRSSESAPRAVVTVSTYVREAGRWVRARVHHLSQTYFWNTVTGPRAVCRLEITTAAGGRGRAPRLVVQLLLSPSLGCGRTYALALASR